MEGTSYKLQINEAAHGHKMKRVPMFLRLQSYYTVSKRKCYRHIFVAYERNKPSGRKKKAKKSGLMKKWHITFKK